MRHWRPAVAMDEDADARFATLEAAAAAQMRRRPPPVRASKRARVAEEDEEENEETGVGRFDYGASEKWRCGETFRGGFVVTCAFNREKCATKDAVRVLRTAASAVSASGMITVGKLPCRGALLLTLEGSARDGDAAAIVSRAMEDVRSGRDPGSRFVEKIFPIHATFDAGDAAGLARACARVVERAVARRRETTKDVRFAAVYNRRLENIAEPDGDGSEAGASVSDIAYARATLTPLVAEATKRAFVEADPDVEFKVDLKTPNFVVFIEVLSLHIAGKGKVHIVALGGCLEEDNVFVVKSRAIAPYSVANALTPKRDETPKWMIKKMEREAAVAAATKAAAAAAASLSKTTAMTQETKHHEDKATSINNEE